MGRYQGERVAVAEVSICIQLLNNKGPCIVQ